MRPVRHGTSIACAVALSVIGAGCDGPVVPEPPADGGAAPVSLANGPGDGPHALAPALFDIAAAPDGGILVAGNTSILEIRGQGIAHVADIPAIPGATVNGVAATGRGSLFATTGGPDLAAGTGVWHVSHGGARLVGDIEAFETANDPDAFAGPRWKDQACEEDPLQGFSAGPQSNPYHLTALSGSTVLLGDAAGNTVLAASRNGDVDWVAVLTPPVDANGDWRFLKTAESDPSIDCYVQPVPTSVAIGPDGAYYVGELTGAPAVPGWSRVWRLAPGARHVVCPSDHCEEVLSGFTSIIDVEFGPDGSLYVVEYDENGWLAVVIGAPLAGGTLNRCDPGAGTCQVAASGLTLPSAITFDKRGQAWLLENNIVAPTVRRLALP